MTNEDIPAPKLTAVPMPPEFPSVEDVFEALRPIIRALPITTQNMGDEAVLSWSKDTLRVGDIRGIRKVWDQAIKATDPAPCSVCGKVAPLVDHECPDCRH
jgi:hypothetical protein